MLQHLIDHLQATREMPLILDADNTGVMTWYWYVDASFAVHPNMRGQTDGGLIWNRNLIHTVLLPVSWLVWMICCHPSFGLVTSWKRKAMMFVTLFFRLIRVQFYWSNSTIRPQAAASIQSILLFVTSLLQIGSRWVRFKWSGVQPEIWLQTLWPSHSKAVHLSDSQRFDNGRSVDERYEEEVSWSGSEVRSRIVLSNGAM